MKWVLCLGNICEKNIFECFSGGDILSDFLDTVGKILCILPVIKLLGGPNSKPVIPKSCVAKAVKILLSELSKFSNNKRSFFKPKKPVV